MIDPRLAEFATCPNHQQQIDAYIQIGSMQKAANALGIDKRTMERAIARARKEAERRGYSPDSDHTKPVPETMFAKRISTNYGPDGGVNQQWVIAEPDKKAQVEALTAAIKAMAEEVPKAKITKAPTKTVDHLLNNYVITDYHLGMLAWDEEAGANWDTDIAEQLLVDWFSAAIAASPKAHTGVFCQLGDFLHWDGLDAVTPAHRHVLDADTRFQRLVRVTIRVIRRITDMLLKRHEEVVLLMAEGNHDPASSIWLRELLHSMYADEPRVLVETSPDPYYCIEWGLTSLFYHHGHKKKLTSLDDVFAAKFREVFGRTKFSYAHTGHLHNRQIAETNLMILEQHRTLAASDAYASRGGWCSGRDAQVITYHKDYGEVGRVVMSPDMVCSA